jgi:hypothetical protein
MHYCLAVPNVSNFQNIDSDMHQNTILPVLFVAEWQNT